MFLSIDRFDGVYAVCEGDNRKLHAIKRSKLPPKAMPGDILNLSKNGDLTVDLAETARRKKRIRTLQDKLFDVD